MNMKNKSTSIINLFGIILVLLFISACNQPDNSRVTQAKNGKLLYDNYCVSCHGQDGGGDGVAKLDAKAADLTMIMKSRKAKQFPIGQIARYIDGRSTVKSHGTREMPIWGTELMEKEQLQTNAELKGKLGEIIAYLMSIQK